MHQQDNPGGQAGIWSETIRIHSYDVDAGGQASLEAVSRHALEAAWNHAETLGVGFARLAEQGKLWVLSRLLFEVRRPVRWGETLRLDTWPRPPKSAFAMRDFELVDAAGRSVVAGVSAWLVLDGATRKPQRIDKLFARFTAYPERRALPVDPQKLFPAREGPALAQRTVQYSDIDVNRHVNSARYIGWVLDAYPPEVHRSRYPARLEANYVGETRAGESVALFGRETAPGQYAHSVVKAEGLEVFRARLNWRLSSG